MITINTNPAYWCGVIPEPGVLGVEESGIIKATEPCKEFFDWFPYVRPSINQQGESCVGWSFAHWFTGMQIRYGDPEPFDDGWYLDGQAVWIRGREMFWGGDMKGGLYLPQGFRAAASLGIIPNDSRIMRVAPDWDSVGLALRDTPILQGHAIHEGWFRANTVNGCIDHAPLASGSNGYHATLRVARLIQEADKRFFVLQNSWGAGWAFAGYGVMSESEDKEGLMQPGLYTARMGPGWITSQEWRKYLKKT
ncbi:MAG: hypothetical protein WC657_09340 [Candidatus Paceibacterota bacterium]|jgi:hypothetical protein